MAQHTPGPWAVSRYAGGESGVYQEGGDGRDVAIVRLAPTVEEHRANAALIAAAPLLAEALRLALGDIEILRAMAKMPKPDSARMGEDALAEAEGN